MMKLQQLTSTNLTVKDNHHLPKVEYKLQHCYLPSCHPSRLTSLYPLGGPLPKKHVKLEYEKPKDLLKQNNV